MTDLAWCAADPHFERGDPALPMFEGWLGAFASSGTPNLVLLGDLFQVWVGLPAAQTGEQRAVLNSLADLVRAGRQVVYLQGNRDYFIETPLAEAGVLLRDEWDLEAPGGIIHFEHGDLVNTSDRNYLRWREVSRSATVGAVYRLLPAERQRALAERLERGLSGTNAYYKAYRPDEEIDRWASRLARDGIRSAVLGHFHVNEVVHASGVTIRFVPQFRTEGEHVRIAPEGTVTLHGFR